MKLPAGALVEVWVRSEELWSPRVATLVTKTRGGEQNEIHVPVYPTGLVTGQVEVPDRGEIPEELESRFRQAAVDGPLVEGLLGPVPESRGRCPVDKEGVFTCRLPVASLDLQLRARGHVPHYLWALEVRGDQPRLVERVLLRPGASVAGWVLGAEEERPVVGARVELTPAQAGPAPGGGLQRRLEQLTFDALSDSRGFFQMAGVSPGQYRLKANGPEGQVGQEGPLQVPPGSELRLSEGVTLQPPATLDFLITPAAAPDQEPWRLALTRAEDPGAGFRRLALIDAEEGRYRARNLIPGRYFVEVQDAAGSSWHFAPLEVSGSENVSIDLLLTELEGRVTFDGEGLLATLYFGGQRGKPRLIFESDEEGFFRGVLPRAGAWRLDVASQEPRFQRRLRDVEVRPPGDGSPAFLEIDLVDRRLTGRLVDSEGRGARGFALLARPASLPEQQLTDSDGYFSYRGLDHGTYSIQGYSSGDAVPTELLTVEISRDPREPVDVELELWPVDELEGRVISAWGPVPGATVLSRLDPGDRAGVMLSPPARSDVDGSFRLRIPQSLDRLDLTIAAPGYGLKAIQWSRSQGRSLDVRLSQYSGSLRLRFAGSVEELIENHAVWQDGIQLDSSFLLRWAQVHGRGLTRSDEGGAEPPVFELFIPALEPARYSLCSRKTREACREDLLLPYSELVLETIRAANGAALEKTSEP
ncbi:MAG: carboxypeptidase-like regulatory domain-containing protein [Acidobacteriota bacterium]